MGTFSSGNGGSGGINKLSFTVTAGNKSSYTNLVLNGLDPLIMVDGLVYYDGWSILGSTITWSPALSEGSQVTILY